MSGFLARTPCFASAGAATLASAALAFTLVSAPLGAQPALQRLVPPSPAPNGFIHDGGPILDDAAVERLNARIADVQRRTGGDIAVAILRDIEDRAASEVGVAIYRAWEVGRIDSIGSARRDLGALLLIVPRELAPSGRGDCWITTGIGAEGELRDAEAGTICRQQVIPELREQRYEAAIQAGIDGIDVAFERTTSGLQPPDEVGTGGRRGGRGPLVATIVAGVFALFGGGAGAAVFLSRYRRRRPRPCPRGHGPMQRLDEASDDAALAPGQQTEERIGSVDYDVWQCRECSERIVIPYRRWSRYERCPECAHRTMKRSVRTVTAATQHSTGVEEITRICSHCGWRDVKQRTTPRLPPPGSSGSGGRSGGGGGSRSSFGGSGRTSGGGGGGRY